MGLLGGLFQREIAATIEANGKYNSEIVTFKTGDFEMYI